MPRLARSGSIVFLLVFATLPSVAVAVSPQKRVAQGTTSPDGTTTPPAASVVDASGAIWTIGSGRSILRNNVSAANGVGDLILWLGGSIYVNNLTYPDANGSWWQWLGSSWSPAAGDPRTSSSSSSLTGPSPSGTTTPPAASILDSSGAIWTIAADRRILRSSVQAANGVGDLILWFNSTIYVNNRIYPDANGSWWQWLGSGWSPIPGDPRTSSTLTAAPPPPSPSAVGPQSTITCPVGAVNIWPGMSISSTVASYGGGTTFCIHAGVYYLTSSITPKTGDIFVGEYGAILDGSSWTTGDDTQAAFRAHNQDIDYVTIRNLVIRNMPQRGIHAYYYMSNNWTVEYTEIASSKNVGIVFPGDSLLRNNYIHHNAYAGYMGPYVHNTTLEGNEIAYNGWEQKVMESANVTFRNNFVHHNTGAGIWFDSNNTGALVEGNRVEDNGHAGIWYEISSDAIFRNNVIRRSADTAIFVSTSQNVQIYGNTLENNFRSILYFLNCYTATGQGFDLRNNTAHDNTIIVGTQNGVIANGFSYGGCTSTQVAPYAAGLKGLTFSRNTYRVPSLSGWYWIWDATKFWGSWQGLGMDVDGSVSQ
jgi:parallel beta-helix repeat protein